MNPPAVLVPVKSTGAKSRLSQVLSEKERREFVVLLLLELLAELRKAALIGNSRVISSDGRILGLAASKGALPVRETADAGVNEAVLEGIKSAEEAAAFLVLPADLPLITSSHILHLLRMGSSGLSVVLAPSLGFNGTNALVFSPRDGLELSYDRDSFWNHLRSAARCGISTGVCSTKEVMFDVDTPSDLRALASMKSTRPPVVFARRVLH
jgi:2-phospho-L-lactate/phosphoenolpyruvate guanylyltransferase